MEDILTPEEGLEGVPETDRAAVVLLWCQAVLALAIGVFALAILSFLLIWIFFGHIDDQRYLRYAVVIRDLDEHWRVAILLAVPIALGLATSMIEKGTIAFGKFSYTRNRGDERNRSQRDITKEPAVSEERRP